MSEQVIISIGREYGSGGHVIAEALAERFGLDMYDVNLLREIAVERGLDASLLEKYDEVPKIPFFSKSRRGYSNSPSENIAKMQFEYLRDKAEKGESFVVVGRCSETMLKGYPGMISIFILGDKAAKIERIKTLNHISAVEADIIISRKDKQRKSYHNYYCAVKWGDSRNYDISINSTPLGIEGTADALETYIRARIAAE